jgi:hypothetical protein
MVFMAAAEMRQSTYDSSVYNICMCKVTLEWMHACVLVCMIMPYFATSAKPMPSQMEKSSGHFFVSSSHMNGTCGHVNPEFSTCDAHPWLSNSGRGRSKTSVPSPALTVLSLVILEIYTKRPRAPLPDALGVRNIQRMQEGFFPLQVDVSRVLLCT